ncbi:hypothetical protein JTB14_022098 [Gonioctena quinquepunctata]|nr:hypothetical protein JTB14_022098 [Gonioctena quinquepunctata]
MLRRKMCQGCHLPGKPRKSGNVLRNVKEESGNSGLSQGNLQYPTKPEEASTRFRLILQELYDIGRISGNVADEAKQQFEGFIRKQEGNEELTKVLTEKNVR